MAAYYLDGCHTVSDHYKLLGKRVRNMLGGPILRLYESILQQEAAVPQSLLAKFPT